MRAENWPALLQEYLEATRGRHFDWGNHDCALWAARWVHLCTGRDHFSAWAGRYASEVGAYKEILRRGFRSVADIADSHLEAKEVGHANRGDLMLDPNGCLGICNGLYSHFVTDEGLLMHRTLDCLKAWEVS